MHGSGTLVRWLLENDLVDEMTLLIVPVVLGQGTRLFPGTGPDMALDLAASRADSKGVTIQVYRPRGARGMPPAEAGDAGAALGGRPGASRMAKAPWPVHPQPIAPATGLPLRPSSGCQAASTHFATPSPQTMPR